MTEVLIISLMVLQLMAIAALILLGKRAILTKGKHNRSPDRDLCPTVAVIAPVTGASEHLLSSIESLLEQGYPDYRLIFVIRDRSDPASEIVEHAVRSYPHACVVYSGKARTCSQKNHSLIAGVAHSGDSSEILVFCDVGHLAPSGWLEALIEPIACGQAVVTTGYHHIVPKDFRTATLGRAVNVLAFYLPQGIPRVVQPWGGSTAIRASAFKDLAVRELWRENVVDDVSLAMRLQEDSIPVVSVPEACLDTPLEGETFSCWCRWLTRQLLYIKFCFPGSWIATSIFSHILAGLTLLSAARALSWLLPGDYFSWIHVLSAALFLGLITASFAILASLHPKPGPLRSWIRGGYAFLFMMSWCHIITLFSKSICWRGIRYKVSFKGKVTGARDLAI